MLYFITIPCRTVLNHIILYHVTIGNMLYYYIVLCQTARRNAGCEQVCDSASPSLRVCVLCTRSLCGRSHLSRAEECRARCSFFPMSQPEAKRPRLLLAPVYSASKRIGLHSSSAQTSPSARVTPAVTTAATAATSPDETQESQWCPFYLAYTVKFTEE